MRSEQINPQSSIDGSVIKHVGKNFYCLGEIEPFNRHLVEIGDNCLLGGQSKIILHGPIRPYKKFNNIILHDLVWTGFRVLILPGTKIGRACLVGANSLVFGTFPSYSIIAGSPCTVIKKRDGKELLRFFIIRILMSGILGVTKPDWSLLTMDHIKYVFGYNTDDPYDESLNLDDMTVDDVISHYSDEDI